MSLHGINHCALRVRDLDRAEAFYVGLLGLERVGERPGMRFYSSGRHPHELALVEDPRFTGPGPGLAHISWHLTDETAFRELHHRLADAGWPVGPIVDHTISHGFYLRDPDGYLLEMVLDRPAGEWQGRADAFRRDRIID